MCVWSLFRWKVTSWLSGSSCLTCSVSPISSCWFFWLNDLFLSGVFKFPDITLLFFSLHNHYLLSVQFSSVAQSCLTLCDPMNRSTPGLPVHHQLLEFTQTQRPSSPWCHTAISSSVIPFSSCPQSLPASESFQWVNSSHEVAKVLSFSFSIIPSKEIPIPALIQLPVIY